MSARRLAKRIERARRQERERIEAARRRLARRAAINPDASGSAVAEPDPITAAGRRHSEPEARRGA